MNPINKKRPLNAETQSSPINQDEKSKEVKHMACRECRQQKVKCNYSPPGPCVRCNKRGLACDFVPDYKRTSKRKKLEQLQNDMSLLRQQLAEMNEQESSSDAGTEGLGDSRSSAPPPPSTAVKLHGSSNSPPVGMYSPVASSISNKSTPTSMTPMVQMTQMAPMAPIGQGPSINQIPSMANMTSTNQVSPMNSMSSGKPSNTNLNSPVTSHGSYGKLPSNYPRNGSSMPSPQFFYKSEVPAQRLITHVSTENLKCSPKTLDAMPNGSNGSPLIVLDSATIASLYMEFTNNYHSFLPVVDIARGPEQIYALSPPLFWTIMAVGARRYKADPDIYTNMSEQLTIMLGEVCMSPTLTADGNKSFNVPSVYTVQAILLRTLWPPIISAQTADPSWRTSGVALFAAIHAGLHSPGYARDFGRIKVDNPIYPKISEQIRTWVACNVVNQEVASVYGFPSFISFDSSVVAACQPESYVDIPLQLRQLMTIQYFENEVVRTLNSNVRDPLGLVDRSERLSLLLLLERRLDEMEIRLGNLDDERKLALLSARLHLMTYYFLDNSDFEPIQLQKGLLLAYNGALAFLSHCLAAQERDPGFIQRVPQIYWQTVWQSSSIINKLVHSSMAEFLDVESGKSLYFKSSDLVQLASIYKHDLAFRAVEIMGQAWDLYERLNRKSVLPPVISVRTRLAASVFYDMLWTLRNEAGIQSKSPVDLVVRVDQENSSQTPSLMGDMVTEDLLDWDAELMWKEMIADS